MMKNKEKVSIIVPVYNCELFVGDCLDSLIKQTYKNIEIILINDGSKDNSGTICEKYAKLDDRIKYISKENGGVSKARNIGLDNVTGDYVLFVDSDDWIELSTIEILMKEIGNYDVIQFGTLEESKGTMLKRPFTNDKDVISNINSEQLIKNVIVPELMEKELGCIGLSRPVCSKFYRFDKIKDIRFKENMKFYEDGEYFLQVCEKNVKCKILPQYLYYYRENLGSCTRKYRENILDESKTIINELTNTLQVLGCLELIDYVKVDMFCVNINNVIRKDKFTCKEVKNICKEEAWILKNSRLNVSGYKFGRKLLLFFLKHKMYLFIYLLCKLKKHK